MNRTSILNTEIDTGQNVSTDIDWDLLPCIKPGIRLPKSDLDWKLANNYFVAALSTSGISSSDINNTLQTMNSVIYEYFRENFGILKDANTLHLVDNYKDCSNNLLKSKLKSLKKMNADLVEIKYVAKLLRTKLRDNSHLHISPIDHDKQIQKNFWGYIKTHFIKSTSLPASFDVHPLLPKILCFHKSNKMFPNTGLDSTSWKTFYII